MGGCQHKQLQQESGCSVSETLRFHLTAAVASVLCPLPSSMTQVYVLHYKGYRHRKRRMQRQLTDLGLPGAYFVETFMDHDNHTRGDIDCLSPHRPEYFYW